MHVLSTPPAFVLSQDQTLRECFPVIGITTRERNDQVGIRPVVHSVLAVVAYPTRRTGRTFQRNHQPAEAGRGINISGVDFWHAVEFSRNGRFLCTHPLGLSSGRFPSFLRFRLYQIFPTRFPRRLPAFTFRFRRFRAFPFRRFRLYQILSGLTPSQRGLPSRPLGRSDG